MFLEDDDLFGGTPEKKYFDIMFNANRNLVEYYMTANLQKIVVLEKMLEKHLDLEADEDVDLHIRRYVVNNQEEVDALVTNLYIVDMGNILTQNE
ncbi:MAG TPA: DUF2018 family protein [Campylobacterales bacterium]|nr:DUF2018 family protein [Campylobacterales bacterium]HIP60916.1 DUF2018 family protein [Campylobacterales bacterium]